MRNSQQALARTRLKHDNLAKTIQLALLGLGGTALVISIVYVSSILAFIGLGLLFWGIILFYIRTEEYVKEILLDATAMPPLATLDQIIQELDYKGNAIYLPPKYFRAPETTKAFIPKQKDAKLPSPEQIQAQETNLFIENVGGMLLTPPGAGLTKLFEETLETNFIGVDLQYLQKSMPKLFIEDLEIAQNFEIEIENKRIHVRIENSAYKDLFKEAKKLANLYDRVGSPLSSAIACALAKVTGKPIVIENQQISEDGGDVDIYYRVLEEEQKR